MKLRHPIKQMSDYRQYPYPPTTRNVIDLKKIRRRLKAYDSDSPKGRGIRIKMG